MADIKARIAKRVAKEFHDGNVVNLGIGLPTMVPQFVPEDIIVTLHSENGFTGLDATISDISEMDPDVIDSGGSYVSVLPRVKYNLIFHIVEIAVFKFTDIYHHIYLVGSIS